MIIIKTQTNELVKCIAITYDKSLNGDFYFLRGQITYDCDALLGYYSTKETRDSVLNDIYLHMTKVGTKQVYTTTDEFSNKVQTTYPIIYEMPQDIEEEI